MENKKDFSRWRAEKLGYVYFSRREDLIINEQQGVNDFLFDYLIDIAEYHKQTGRLFGVEIKVFKDARNYDFEERKYKHITFPVVLVLFDAKTDEGFYTWIKKPAPDGRLATGYLKAGLKELNNNTLNEIVNEIKNWYAHIPVA